MRTFSIDIWKDFSYLGAVYDEFRPSLDGYLLKTEGPARPGVVILPGSGYRQCSPREAEALAVRFNAAGYHAFVLWYSCAPRRHPIPLLDCARGLTIIRDQARDWDLDPARLGLMGFSAGAHVALSETVFRSEPFAAVSGINPGYSRADALMLCYPVVTTGEFAHRDSFTRLLGERPDPKLLDLLSLEKHIAADLPPVFLWHTYTDGSVPVENSFLLAVAMRRAGIPLEMHIFPEGKHGLSLAIPETDGGDPQNINFHAAQWFPLCLNWLKLQFKVF